MAKQLYGHDLVEKIADVIDGRHFADSEDEARAILEALTETFDAVRLKGYQKGFEDALSEPPF